MKPTNIMLSILVSGLIISCGGGAEVGHGGNLSLLSTEPTGLELAQSILHMHGAHTVSRSLTENMTQKVETITAACSGTGTITSKVVTPKIETGAAEISAEFNHCEGQIFLSGAVYNETVSGSFNMSGTRNSNSILTYLSISGDLGLSAQCNVTNLFSPDGSPKSGECVFKDNSGKEIKASIDELTHLEIFGG